jgi:tetratricopeptide (TPR) repeat protein
MGEVNGWLAKNPPAKEELKKGTEAAVMMLEYRILATEAEASPAGGANEKAVGMLQTIMAKRPDLAGVINEQLMARLPENPAVKDLLPMLLRAMVQRGDEEIRKGEDQPLDKKALAQAVAAATELVKRAGKQGVTAEDAEVCTLELGLFYARLGQTAEAANTFLDYTEKYRNDARRLGVAFDNAAAAVAKLKKERPDDKATGEAYLRFLGVATGPAFGRNEYAFEYARVLLERNISVMRGTYGDGQRKQMLEGAKKAVELFARVTDEKRLLHARYFGMLAYNQAIDLMAADAAELGGYIKKTQELAVEVNGILDTEMAGAGDAAAKEKLRWFRVRTALLAADLAKHDTTAGRDESLKRAVALLAKFERDVEGMANANNLLGEALFIRVNALMSLKRSDEALENLGRFLEARSGDDGIRIVYEMLENLNKEFQQAQQNGNTSRMAEVAGHRAKVSGYLVDRVSKSKRPEIVKLLPKYRMFEAGALQQAAVLEKDEAKRRGYLQGALGIYETALKASPGDDQIRFNVAVVQVDLGQWAAAQPVLVQLLKEGKVGKAKKEVAGADGNRLVDNDSYWDAMYRLLRCNVELAKAKAAGYDAEKLVEETGLKLKQLYIQWGEPGGARWAGKFEELRKQVLPGWVAPVLGGEGAAETRPAGGGATDAHR